MNYQEELKVNDQRLMNYQEALASIAELTKFGINLGLARITALLGRLGNPQDTLAIVHVGGTNGKGSTAAMLASALTEAGYRVGVFSSPHLISYTERFTINSEAISEEDFAAILAEIWPAFRDVRAKTGENPTEFEVLTAMAFLYFQRQKVDILILEVGLGGDIDSTNVIKRPLLSIITNVSLEHIKYLGDTLAEIADKKSGIIKDGCPVITAAADETVIGIIKSAARAHAAPFYQVQEEVLWEFKAEHELGQVFQASVFRRNSAENLGDNLSGSPVKIQPEAFDKKQPGDVRAMQAEDLGEILLALRGEHQLLNAATTILALKLLNKGGWKISNTAIRDGLTKVKWPGRLEILRKNPLVVADGAHNPAGMAALARWLASKQQEVGRVILIIGMLEDKDRVQAVRIIEPYIDEALVTKPLSERSGAWQETGSYFRKEISPEYYETLTAAVERALTLAEDKDLILITGSLYLLGELYGIIR